MANIQIRSNQSQVQPQLGQHVGAQTTLAPFESRAKLIGGIYNHWEQYRDQDEALKVMNASNAVNKRLGELRLDIAQNMQGTNGFNAQAFFDQNAKQIVDEEYARSNIRYRAGETAFRRAVGANVVSGSLWARGFQNQQFDTAMTTSYNQFVSDCIKDVAEGGNIQDNFDKCMFMANTAFAHRPAEQRKQMEQQTAVAYGSQLIQDAISRNDYIAGERALAFLRDKLPSDTFLKLSDALYKNQEYGENMDLGRALAEARKKQNMSIDEQRQWVLDHAKSIHSLENGEVNLRAGKEYWRGLMGSNLGVNQCANTVTGWLKTIGANSELYSSTADGMQLNAERAGVAFNDRSQLADGDIVFWRSGDRFTPSDNPNAVNSNSQAYHGTTHVGVYNASTGKVVQAGTHGVQEIPLDTYPITGFAHPRGAVRETGMSNMRMDSVIHTADIYDNDEKRREAQENEMMARQANDTIFGMYQAGSTYDEVDKYIRDVVGKNWRLGMALEHAASWFYGPNGGGTGPNGTGGGKGADAYGLNKIKTMIADRRFQSRDDLEKFCDNVAHLNANQKFEIMKAYEDSLDGKGQYKFDWSDAGIIKQQVCGDATTDAQKILWDAVKPMLQEYTRQYIEKNGREPTYFEIIDEGERLMQSRSYGGYTPTSKWYSDWYWEGLDISDAQLRALGIVDIAPADDGSGTHDRWIIHYTNGRIDTNASYDEVKRIAEMAGAIK